MNYYLFKRFIVSHVVIHLYQVFRWCNPCYEISVRIIRKFSPMIMLQGGWGVRVILVLLEYANLFIVYCKDLYRNASIA